ncbi:MAG: glycoside hydrolase family 95 protein, partial [Ignavibacteriaceae bacterium]|nr:glycoside hydrolase family 95 protein [Ignavibacteriaceae bacterium]
MSSKDRGTQSGSTSNNSSIPAPSDLALWYPRPAAQWVEALPIGNGRLGAMVFGGIGRELLQLNEDTLWSGNGPHAWNNPHALDVLPQVRRLLLAGEYEAANELCKQMQGPFTESYQPLGNLVLTFDSLVDAWVSDVPTDYQRSLDLHTAVATTRFVVDGVTYTRECFVSAPDQVIVVRLSADQPGKISCTATLESLHPAQLTDNGAQSLSIAGRAPSHVVPNYDNMPNPIVYTADGGIAFDLRLQAIAEGGQVTASAQGVRVENADAATLILAAGTSFNGYQNAPSQSKIVPSARAAHDLAAASQQPYATLRARHEADYGALFGRVTLDLGTTAAAQLPTDERIRQWHDHDDPHFVTLLFQYGRYLLISSSRPGSQPANLQGIWNEHIRPPWSSNYTININTQMNYWPAEVANLAECHLPLFEMIRELSETGAKTAATNYGCRGWVAHHNTDLWRQSAPVGDFGRGDPVWAHWLMSGGWLCQHLWEHFAFGRDEQFLREQAYPLMREAAQFYLDWLYEGPDGFLMSGPSTSPENPYTTADGQHAAVCNGSTMDMMIIWDLFTNCIEASEILGIDAEFRQAIESARQKLRPLTIGQHGQLQEWEKDWDDPQDQHRHCSHLFGLHPGRQITPQGTPELFDAARRSLEFRGDGATGWSMAWKINFWARFLDGDHAMILLSNTINLAEEKDVAISNFSA